MLKPLLLSAVLLFSAAQVSPAAESTARHESSFQLAAATATGHGLSVAQIKELRKQLRSSGAALVVPAYVPAGYVVKDIVLYQNGLCGGLTYSILYLNPSYEYFMIEGNACGFGGSEEPSMSLEIANQSFGKLVLERFGPNDQRKSAYTSIFEYRSKGYSIGSSGRSGNQIPWGDFQTKKFKRPVLRVAGPEMIKIIQNLRPL